MACWSSWNTFSWRSRSRVTSAIDHTVMRASCLLVAERAHAQAQPARGLGRGAGNAHLLLQAAALARGLEQAVDRFGDVGIADEHPLDRPHVVAVGRPDQVEIGGVGVEHAAGLVGDHDAVEGIVDHRLEQRIALAPAGKLHDAGGHGEQRDDADGAEQRQQRQDVGSGVRAARYRSGRRRRAISARATSSTRPTEPLRGALWLLSKACRPGPSLRSCAGVCAAGSWPAMTPECLKPPYRRKSQPAAIPCFG